jgi:hypothetical protein
MTRGRNATVVRGHGRSTPTALQLRTGIQFDDWLEVGRQISLIASASGWWLGDWLVYGQRTYRERYRTALDATPLDYQTLRNYAWVARRFDQSRRRGRLSFQHHAEVASMAEPDQDIWLQRAERLGWSRNELRRQLGVARRRTLAAGEETTIVVRMQVGAPRERRWREAASAANQELGDWLASAADDAAGVTFATPNGASPANGGAPLPLDDLVPATGTAFAGRPALSETRHGDPIDERCGADAGLGH